MRRKQSRWNRRGITRVHSERRGIDDKIDIRKLRAQCRFLPSRCFKARCGAEHAWSGKKRPQPLRERLRFFVSTIYEDKTFTILERTLPGNCAAGSTSGAEDHHPQIAHVDREFASDAS